MNNASNATNSTPSLPTKTPPNLDMARQIIQMCITWPAVFFGLVGNFLVIVIIVLKRRHRKTNNDLFLLNLACADFIYICLNTGNFVYHLSYFYPSFKTLSFCKIFFPMMSVSFTAGVFTIAAMSIYRCWVITNPFKPKTRPLWVQLCVLVTWVLAVCLLLPYPILAVNKGRQCQMVNMTMKDTKVYYSIITIVQYPLPLLIVLIAYLRIGVYLRKPRVPQLSIVARGKTLRSPRDETRKESIAMAKTVGAIVIAFAVLLLPLQIAMHAFLTFEIFAPWTDMLWSYGDRLSMIHSALNPYLYTIRTPQYRKQIMSWIHRSRGINYNPTLNTSQKVRSRCQSFTPSCTTTEVVINENKDDEQVEILTYGGLLKSEKQTQVQHDVDKHSEGVDIEL